MGSTYYGNVMISPNYDSYGLDKGGFPNRYSGYASKPQESFRYRRYDY